MLKDEIEKNIRLKKGLESTQVNSSNSWLESWDENNLIENNSKQIMKYNSQ